MLPKERRVFGKGKTAATVRLRRSKLWSKLFTINLYAYVVVIYAAQARPLLVLYLYPRSRNYGDRGPGSRRGVKSGH